jgi:glycosyltransferase involved in cell wall biosynthesis
VWNHRWEHDKNPHPFFAALYRLAEEGVPFEVALVGENVRQQPVEFEEARERLGARVVRYGYVDSFADYARLLWEADVVVSTSNQGFFEVSVVEEIYCGCWPVLPDRLNYPALVPAKWHSQTIYPANADQADVLRARLRDPRPAPPDLRAHVTAFNWQGRAPRYDAVFENAAHRRACGARRDHHRGAGDDDSFEG